MRFQQVRWVRGGGGCRRKRASWTGQNTRSKRGSGGLVKDAFAGSACFRAALDFAVCVRYLELSMIASLDQAKTTEHKGSPPKIKQYTGEAVYLYAIRKSTRLKSSHLG